MGDASTFVDESGGQGGHSRYYVLALVFHGLGLNVGDETQNKARHLV